MSQLSVQQFSWKENDHGSQKKASHLAGGSLVGMAWTESAGCRTWTHLILAKKVLSHDLFFFFFEERGNILTKSSTNGP